MTDSIKTLRNVAIVAHVDHGKTTLVDKLLHQSGTLGERSGAGERVMDSNDIEKERGITILAKNTAIRWNDPEGKNWRINIVDTPGHADFGGEVERVLSMVDSVVLLIDAAEGPMPQTTFVTKKALAQGLKPIVVGIGRVVRGKLKKNMNVIVASPDGKERKARVLQPFGFMGLERVEMDEVAAGDICCFTGIDKLGISDMICDPDHVDDGVMMEPWETLTIDVEEDHQGKVMEKLGERKGNLKNMEPDGQGRVRLDYEIPTRGLIGFRSEFLTTTSGSGLLYHNFDSYKPRVKAGIGRRQKGVLISNGTGKAAAFALFNLQERSKMFIGHAAEVYEGMVVAINARDNDLVVNVLKGKQLTNVRASGTDAAVTLTTPINVTLEYALEFINDDELVEVTPESIRIRKRYLLEHERKKESRRIEALEADDA